VFLRRDPRVSVAVRLLAKEMVVLEKASEAWRLLNGVFCIYKPSGITFAKLRHIIANNLARGSSFFSPRISQPSPLDTLFQTDLNNMRPELPSPLIKIEPPSEEGAEYRVTTVPDLRRHPLLVGPGYAKEDFYVRTQSHGLTEMAGVVPCSVGNGSKVFHEITGRNPICST
jgi:hypothetical protein